MVTGEWLRQKLVEPLKEKQRQEGRAEGLEEGRDEGRDEGREEGLEEGREEGRAEAHIEWWEWNERRLEAESKGKPFSEPVPYVPNGTTQNRNGSKE